MSSGPWIGPPTDYWQNWQNKTFMNTWQVTILFTKPIFFVLFGLSLSPMELKSLSRKRIQDGEIQGPECYNRMTWHHIEVRKRKTHKRPSSKDSFGHSGPWNSPSSHSMQEGPISVYCVVGIFICKEEKIVMCHWGGGFAPNHQNS